MPLTDPGRLLRANALPEALAILEPGLEGECAKANAPEDVLPEVLVEEVALGSGVRARRLILDGAWWTETGPPMLARVAERRGSSRPKDPRTRIPGGTGWVALVPRMLSGYEIVATDPDTGKTGRWRVTADIASRLAPFAFTFHRGFEARPIGWKDALRFAWSYGRRDVALVVVLGLIAALVGLLTPIGTGHLINKVIPSGSPASVGVVIAGLSAAGLSLIGLQIMRSLAQFRFDSAAGLAVNAAMLDRVITAPASFFRKYASGDLALRVGAMNSVQHTLSSTAIASVVAGLYLLANLGLMIWYSPKLALVAVIPAALAVAIPVIAGLKRLKLAREIGGIHLKLSALSFEYFSGIAKLRAAAAEPRAFGNWIGQYKKIRNLNLKSARLSNLETLAMSVLQPAVAIAIYALVWDIMSGQSAAQRMRVGDFIAFQAALFAVIGGLHLLVGSWISALRVKPQWERAKPILDAVPERSAAHGKRHTPEGSITLENIAFAYPDGPDVLQGISLSVKPGEFIAVVGTSGSGKSTLFRLLLGFEAPRTGTIRYDGQDLAELDLQRLRRGIGTVLQTGKLWAGDLYTNIVGASNADVEAAWHAARLAGVAPDIEKMPMGMYTLVGEGLSTISGGQRQRVLIARALVERPKVLLLDEATSALDAVAQQTVLEGLQGMNATRLVIAHRLDTVRQADRIIVLDAGKIAQEGSYVELAGKPGQFANMLARQGA